MVHTCVVWGCTNRASSTETKRKFFDIPRVILTQGKETERLSTERRNLWLARINREEFHPDPAKRHYKVCSDHFVTGCKAELYKSSHPDWAPSLKMGPEQPSSAAKSESSKKRYDRLKDRQEKRTKFKAAEALLDLQKICPVEDESVEPETDIGEEHRVESINATDNDPPPADAMRMELQRLTSENMKLKEQLNQTIFSPESLKGDNDRVRHYTGLDYHTLMTVYNFIQESVPERTNTAITKFEKVMLVLMKVRLNLSLQDLAYRFRISKSYVSKIFLDVIHILYERLKALILWPEREELRMSMPMEFQRHFGVKVSVIIDCFEIFIERPSSLLARAETWSSYKHHNTVKYLIAITPQGAVSFLSKGWGGRSPDKYITENCGLLDKLLPGDIVLADRRFDIKESVGLCCAEVKIPAFTRGKSQLSPLEIEFTRKIAHTRIRVERVIGLVRNKFKILQSTLPIDYLHCRKESVPTIDKITTVCCALSNLCGSVVPFD